MTFRDPALPEIICGKIGWIRLKILKVVVMVVVVVVVLL